MAEQGLNIVQWNCRSIKQNIPRITELKHLIETQKPHVACLNETWLEKGIDTPKIQGYTRIFRKDRAGREGGGILTLIRDGVSVSSVPICNPRGSILEVQAVEITAAHEKLKLLNIYNPQTRLNTDHYNHLVEQLGRKFIIVGDMNAHHTQWDPEIPTNNQCGNALADYILDEPRLAVATTPGLGTHMNNNGIVSTIDLTICSSNLLNKIETKALPGHGSDHRPILTTVNIAPEIVSKTKRPKWIIDPKKWTRWREVIPPLTEAHNSTDEENKSFVKTIIDTSTAHLKTKQKQK